jgi:hypothetical protein
MVLLGVGKGFLRLVFKKDNGIVVDGKPLCISTETQQKMVEMVKAIKPHGSFTKGFCGMAECETLMLQRAPLLAASRDATPWAA